MKNCPKCGAQIDDNARFCVYCMTSFDEKVSLDAKQNESKVKSVVIAATVIILALFFVLFFAFCGKGDNYEDTDSTLSFIHNSDETESMGSDSSEPINGNNSDSSDSATASDTIASNSSTQDGSNSSGKPNGVIGGSSSETSSKTSSKTPSNTPSPTPPPATVTSYPTDSSGSEGTNPATPSDSYPQATATYLYREANSSDDAINYSSTATNGGVTITGVKTASPNGIYVIPEKIDGKKVVAVASHAFSDDLIKDAVKVVVFPKSVISVNAYSFYSCYNITDIYFAGNTYIAGDAFAPDKRRTYIITLHCPSDATNRNFTKLSTFAMYYNNMLHESWNGGAIG